MEATDFTTVIVADQSAAEVFEAINNVKAWWQGDIEGNTTHLGDEFTYRMDEIHYSKQKIVAFIPNEKVVWEVSDSKLNPLKFKDESEWTGTKIVFEITEIGNKTQVRFTHMGLVPTFECYGDCSWAWGQLIEESLKSLITTGKGVNVFG